MSYTDVELAYDLALRAEEAAAYDDLGTTRGHPTLRKGIVTSTSPFQVDGLPASNISGARIAVDAVVWLLVDAGRRLVIAAAAPPQAPYRMAAGTVVFTTPGTNGQVDVPVTFPSGRFTQPPIVTGMVQDQSRRLILTMNGFSAHHPTVAGCTFSVQQGNVSGTNARLLHWQAIQMTPTNASG